jgi:hypothetical protein
MVWGLTIGCLKMINTSMNWLKEHEEPISALS